MTTIHTRWLPLLLAAVITLAAPRPAPAQVAEIAGGVAVSTLVQSFKTAIEEMIDALGGQFDRSSFQLRQSLLLLVDNVDHTATGLLDRTFGQLNATQQEFFRNVHGVTEAWRESNEITRTTAEEILGRVDVTLTRIPGTNRQPRVTGYAPMFVVANAVPDSLAVAVRGSLIGGGVARLELETGVECREAARVETRITFLCPGSEFTTQADDRPDRLAFRTGTVHVEGPRSFWDRLTGKRNVATYRVGVTVVPALMGRYRATVTAQQQDRQWATRSQYFPYRNPHCAGRRSLNYDVSPAGPEWRVEVPSIDVAVEGHSRASSFHGVHAATQRGFQIRGVVENTGRCFAGTKDARGSLNLRAHWREWMEVTNRSATVVEGELFWTRDQEIPLPSNEVATTVEIEFVDGSRAVLTRDERAHGWLTADYDRGQRFVLKPIPLERAFR
jgi:hypothetical protein